MAEFSNVYDDATRARAYADLGFPGTYYLAFRDIPALLARHARGTRALDFGCGAGRSSRFLRDLGYEVVGADISEAMLEEARSGDPDGDYVKIRPGELGALGERSFDVVLSAFTFDNVADVAVRQATVRQIAARLADGGCFINLVSAPEIYVHEWTSFSTSDFPENRDAASGDVVRIVMLDVPDRRPVVDVYSTDADYRALHDAAGLEMLELHRPLGRDGEGHAWKTETSVSPWAIYVLARRGAGSG
jgi:SAM-dependent methyltransferase